MTPQTPEAEARNAGRALGRAGFLLPTHQRAGRAPLAAAQARLAAHNLPEADAANPAQHAYREGLRDGLLDRAAGAPWPA